MVGHLQTKRPLQNLHSAVVFRCDIGDDQSRGFMVGSMKGLKNAFANILPNLAFLLFFLPTKSTPFLPLKNYLTLNYLFGTYHASEMV
jgi:hypothetical protein